MAVRLVTELICLIRSPECYLLNFFPQKLLLSLLGSYWSVLLGPKGNNAQCLLMTENVPHLQEEVVTLFFLINKSRFMYFMKYLSNLLLRNPYKLNLLLATSLHPETLPLLSSGTCFTFIRLPLFCEANQILWGDRWQAVGVIY